MTDYGRFGDSIITSWMDGIAAKALNVALCATSPLAGDPLAAELTGGEYHRWEMPMTRTAFNLLANSTLIVWWNLPPGAHISWLAAFDAHINGNLVAAAPIPTPIDLPEGGTYTLDPLEFVMGLDVATGP